MPFGPASSSRTCGQGEGEAGQVEVADVARLVIRDEELGHAGVIQDLDPVFAQVPLVPGPGDVQALVHRPRAKWTFQAVPLRGSSPPDSPTRNSAVTSCDGGIGKRRAGRRAGPMAWRRGIAKARSTSERSRRCRRADRVHAGSPRGSTWIQIACRWRSLALPRRGLGHGFRRRAWPPRAWSGRSSGRG